MSNSTGSSQSAYGQNIELAHRTHDRLDYFEDQLNDGALKAADMGLRTSVAVNGAAVVALLALIGALVGRDKVNGPQLQSLLHTFRWFVGGVASAVAAMAGICFAYWAGALAHHFRERTYNHPYIFSTNASRVWFFVAMFLVLFSVVLGVMSVYLFVRGVMAAQSAMAKIL
jgi:hypothetical protein